MFDQAKILGMDGQTLQGIGSVLAGVSVLATTVITLSAAFFNRNRIGRYLGALILPRQQLIARLDHADNARIEAENRAADALVRAASAEHSATNWQSALEAIENRWAREIESLRADLAEARREHEALKVRNDALVDYGQLMITYSVQLEIRASQSGVNLSGLKMPKIPALLADRLGIPDQLR